MGKVCDTLLRGYENSEDADKLLKMYTKSEANSDCHQAVLEPGVRKTKKFDVDRHLRPLESFCKMDTLDEVCENAWYDDDSDIWKIRTSCHCQPQHTVDCVYGETTKNCMQRMFSNLGMRAEEFDRIEFVVAESDSTTPHTKQIRNMADLYNQMTNAIYNKEKKWEREGKLHAQADIEA